MRSIDELPAKAAAVALPCGDRGVRPFGQYLHEVVRRINSVSLPGANCSLRRWVIPFEEGARPQGLARALEARRRLAARHGLDLNAVFAPDEVRVRAKAVSLAELWYTNQSRLAAGQPFDWSPHEVDVSFTGTPGKDVRNVGRWFRRALLREERRLGDYYQRLLGGVGVDGSPVIAECVLRSRYQQRDAQERFAKKYELFAKVADGEVRTPFKTANEQSKHRFAKAYVRMLGVDEFCKGLGLQGYFVTLTLPAPYHSNPSVGVNRWDGSTPSDGHREMQRRWRTIQRRIGETEGGKLFGARVEEPHGDGCVHWHALFYVDSQREEALRKIIENTFGGGCAAEVVAIDPSKASAASYVMKYLMPSIPSQHVAPGSDSPARYDAHRATWGGRSIVFFDVPGSATMWDELRRLRGNDAANLTSLGASLRDAAVQNRYGDFLALVHAAREQDKKAVRIRYDDRDGARRVRGVVVHGQEIESRVQRDWAVRQIAWVPKALMRRQNDESDRMAPPDSYG